MQSAMIRSRPSATCCRVAQAGHARTPPRHLKTGGSRRATGTKPSTETGPANTASGSTSNRGTASLDRRRTGRRRDRRLTLKEAPMATIAPIQPGEVRRGVQRAPEISYPRRRPRPGLARVPGLPWNGRVERTPTMVEHDELSFPRSREEDRKLLIAWPAGPLPFDRRPEPGSELVKPPAGPWRWRGVTTRCVRVRDGHPAGPCLWCGGRPARSRAHGGVAVPHEVDWNGLRVGQGAG